MLYVSLALYGNALASGVAQEKTSRIAEVLLAAVWPGQPLAGKVVVIGVCGVGRFGILEPSVTTTAPTVICGVLGIGSEF